MQTYNPTLLTAGVQARFFAALDDARQDSYIGLIAEEFNSTRSSETHGWIGEAPAFTTFTGSIRTDGMSDASYAIANSKFTSSVTISRDDLMDDQTQGFNLRISQMAQEAIAHQNLQIITLLTNGTTGTGHDGAAFFANSHTARGQQTAAQDNLLTGTGTTTAQIQADITSAIAAMLKFKKENGNLFHISPREFVIVAPPDIMGQMNEAVYASIVSNTSNVRNRGVTITPIYDGNLTGDANDWYMLRVDGGVKPLIAQMREPVTIEADDSGTSDSSFKKEQLTYKGRYRAGYGYGHWANAVKVVNS